MSDQLKSPFKLRIEEDDEEPSMMSELVVAKQPTDEQPEKEELPAGAEAIASEEEEEEDEDYEEEGTYVIDDPDLEAIKQELTQPRAACEHGDEPQVKGRSLLNLEPIKMPDMDEEQLKF